MDLLWACELESLRAYCDRVLAASHETEQAAALFIQAQPEKRQILAVDGDTAILDIRGTLTNRPSPIASFLGFNTTSYIDLQNAIETIAADDSIKKVRLVVDSPGGNVTGLDETWMAIRELARTKNVVAENHGLMASAAYWLASAADKIVATSPAAETGSIGVYLLAIDWTEYDKNRGIKEIRIVSKNAPLKNPDPATAEGLKAYQERLDALERVFIARVAEGRGVTVQKVEKDFGRGAVLVAQDPDTSKPDAVSVGMIDEVLGAVSAGKDSDRRRKAGDDQMEMFAGSPPFKNYPVIDKPWDADAAIGRIRTKTGSTEKPSATYKNGFFWYDPQNEDNFGGYKLPFVDVVDGEFKAVRRGVFAAKGAMAGARGQKPAIPASDVAAVNSHIDKYVQKIEKEDKEKKGQAAAAVITRKDHPGMKFSDLQAGDPELFQEVEGLITAAKTETQESFKGLIAAVEPVLTGESAAYIKGIAVKVLKGEATEAELEAARAAYDTATEAAKTAHAKKETEEQGATPPASPPTTPPNSGEVKTEEDHQAEVARIKKIRGQEAD